MPIQVLAETVINQISAGEIIERPFAVVRELVDNSVDAGASEISVELEQGGHTLIKVSDNGSGMLQDEAVLSFQRHATSKISSADDLESITTMGFRGEALASIAAVSKVLLRSRVQDAEVGTEIAVEGGDMLAAREVAMPSGTSIEVRNLFYNTPARKKFMRTPKTETQRVKQWFLHSALAHPHIRYRLIVDGAEVLVLARSSDRVERGRSVIKGNTIAVRYPGERIVLEGLVGHPSLAQADTGSFVVLVNKRLISDRMVQRAVRDGFDSTLKDREFPIGFLHISLPPQDVDVNVHPQKSEIRFRDSSAVFKAVRDGVRSSVMEFKTPMTGSATAPHYPDTHYRPSARPHLQVLDGAARYQTPLSFSSPATSKFSSLEAEVTADISNGPGFKFSDLQLVGQVLNCYLVSELDGVLYLVDMHAAHERYNFNVIRNSFRSEHLVSQQLLVPEVVTLTELGVDMCMSQHELFERFGFSIEPFGEREMVIRAVPAILKIGAAKEVVREIAAIVCEEASAGRVQERLDHIAARMACHASVRSGDTLNREEAYALFSALDSTEFSAACPHGRPVVVSFARAAVERWFGRDR